MIKKLTLLISVVVLFSTMLIAQSFTALYKFDSVKAPSTNPPVVGTGLIDPTPLPTATGVTFGSFSATGTPSNPNALKRFSFINWPLGATTAIDTYDTLTGSLSATEYYEVTLTPETGYTIDLDSIKFSVERSGTGIRTFAVKSSIDGYISNLAASINPVNAKLSVQTGDIFFWNLDATTSNQNGSKITLGGSSFTGLASPVTFRFYAWNAEANTGSFSIDNVSFAGTAAPATAIHNFPSKSSISVYPNPSTNGLFTVDLGNYSGKTIVTVYNIIGKVIFSNESTVGNKQTIDLSNVANGSYFVNIKNDKENTTKKITINK